MCLTNEQMRDVHINFNEGYLDFLGGPVIV